MLESEGPPKSLSEEIRRSGIEVAEDVGIKAAATGVAEGKEAAGVAAAGSEAAGAEAEVSPGEAAGPEVSPGDAAGAEVSPGEAAGAEAAGVEAADVEATAAGVSWKAGVNNVGNTSLKCVASRPSILSCI